MIKIGVCEKTNKLLPVIRSKLTPGCFSLEKADADTLFDCIIIGETPFALNEINAKIAIAPDYILSDAIAPNSFENIITYGLCQKSTLTASSLIGERLIASLQKEISTLSGEKIDEQEFFVTTKHAENSDEILGIVALLLVLGIPPSEISKLCF